MLYAHGPDLCHESDLRHAMANAFEAMMAAIYLDAGIDECDRFFFQRDLMFKFHERFAWFFLKTANFSGFSVMQCLADRRSC